MPESTDCTVLVCGGGNAAQVLSGLLAIRYRTIAVSLFADEAARWKAALGPDQFELTVEGAAVNTIKSRPADITNDPSVASIADVIVLVVPGFAHAEYFEKLGPHMKPGTIVAVMPACSGADLLFNAKVGENAKDMIFMGFETLPWACRATEWGRKATILGTKNSLKAAVTPTSARNKALGTLQGLIGVYPLLSECSSNLAISLQNPSLRVHPGVMYGRWGPETWDGKPLSEKPLFYQGVDDFTEKILLDLDDELLALCRAMEELVPGLDLKEVCTTHQIYMEYYSGQMADTSTLRSCMNTNSAYDGLRHPCLEDPDGYRPDLKNRYLTEDIPTGLCFVKGLAEIVGVETPVMDKVLMWAQQGIEMELLVEGKMTGKDVCKTRAPQGVGITTIEQFLQAAQLQASPDASR